jgi:FkbM family methyltransferase
MRLPMSRLRALGARAVYRLLRLFLETRRVITRNGICYEVDLSDGLDLSLFVFGSFQRHVAEPRYFRLAADAVVLDVGANAGVMSLAYARLCPHGRIYAFEPTDSAFARLRRNLELNPALATRIRPVKMFAGDRNRAVSNLIAYARWPVDRRHPDAHAVHCGLQCDAQGAPETTLDEFAAAESLVRVDLIKIDTDGNELAVLRGAGQILRRWRPAVVFEVGRYLLAERGVTPRQYFDLFAEVGYRLRNLRTGRQVTPENFVREVPALATTDLVAVAGDAPAS